MFLKFLKIIAAIMFFMMVAFVFTGLFCRSFSYQTTAEINKSPSEVYTQFTDNEALKIWMTGLSNVQTIKKTENEVGSVYKFFVKDPQSDGTMTFTETITEAIPGELYAFTMDNEWFSGSNAYQFVSNESNQTVLTANTTVKGKGLFKRALLRFMKPAMVKQSNMTNEAFKTFVESD